MIGAIIVGTITNYYGQTIGIMICSYKMITGSFGCAIRRMRIIFCFFRKETGVTQSTVYFIGGHMIKTLSFKIIFPEMFCRVQQVHRTYYIGIHKIQWGSNGTVHMTFGRQVNNSLWLV